MNKYYVRLTEFWEHFKDFWVNLWVYRYFLANQKDWDYEYLLNLERFKLSLMLKYFIKYPHVDHNNDIKWISICIKLIDIILEKDLSYNYDYTSNKYTIIKYVNITNSNRFIKDLFIEEDSKKVFIIKKDHLRQNKALYLYNKIRYNYLLEWWD